MRILLEVPLSDFSGYGELSDRFRSHVLIGEPDECWPWQAAKRKGYGTIKISKGELGLLKRCDVYAHRVAFYLTHGHWPIPIARHTCDNPVCCNPRHLLEGTVKQNHADMISRGRKVVTPGVTSWNSSLAEDDVDAIRRAYSAGRSQTQIARIYGISQTSVSRIVRKVRYK